MNNLNDLIPKQKDDYIRARNLNNYSIKSIKPIVPQLLTWLQDLNWPISGEISQYLRKNIQYIENEIIEILLGNDQIWKYCIIISILTPECLNNPQLSAIINQIAYNPDLQEIEEEVDMVAQEFLENKRIEPIYAFNLEIEFDMQISENEIINTIHSISGFIQNMNLELVFVRNFLIYKGLITWKEPIAITEIKERKKNISNFIFDYFRIMTNYKFKYC